MAITTVTDAYVLVDAVAKSGLLSADSLAKVRERTAAMPDAKALARDLVKDGTLTRWQAAQLLHGFSTLVVGKYRLLDQLGAGETGRVYLAEHSQMNRRHALKILSRRQTSKPDVLKRFLAEAQRVCALDHRNLSHVYDVNQDGDKYFLVMEHVEGQDLKKLVESDGPLAPAKAAELLLQAIDGLQHAHQQQVIHGDLKPSNLIVDASGTLKITEIGQARLVESPASSSADETTEAAALSAALYRAPELLAGKQSANVRSDLYSLGNIVCFLLAGKPAKDADDARRLLKGATDGAAEWVELCGSMLSADPSGRPADIGAVQAAVLAIAKRSADSSASKPAVSNMPKAKKSLVAKALEASDEHAVVASTTNDAEAEPSANSDNPLAGLAIHAPRNRVAKSPVKAVAKSAEPVTPAPGTVESPEAAQPQKSLLPVVIIAAIGGGILVLGGVAVAVLVGLYWAGGETTKAVAAVKSGIDPAAKKASEAAANEKAIEEALAAIGETNPVPRAEANPSPAAVAAAADAPPAAPAPAPEPAKPAEPVPSPESAKPVAETKAEPNSEPAKPEPPKPEPAKPEPDKAEPPKTEPKKPEPAALREPPKAEPAKPAPTKPAAPAAVPSVFKGLPVAVSLPKLEPGMTDPPPAALASLVIGPCTPDATAQLKGGATAQRGGKTQFELMEGKDNQSLGKWNVVMTISKMPLTIAQLSIQDKQLAFQWTLEGARHESSPYLSNCKLVLSAGTDQHEIALREPLKGESLLVDFEKPGATVKWTVEHMPDPRKIVVEISRLGEAFPAHKFDPSPTMEGQSADTLVWTGADPENAVLGVKFESSQTSKFLQVKATAQLKQGGAAKPLLARTLKTIEKEIDQARLGFITQEKVLTNQSGGSKEQQELRKKTLANVKKQQDELNLQGDQFNQLQQLISDMKGKSEVHFRVYCLADDSQVNLVVTDHDPPKEQKAEAKKGDGKKK